MEVHNDASAGAYVAPEHAAEVSALGTFGTRQGDRDTLVRKRQAQAKPLGFVSAAGPGGDGLSRALTNKAAVCWVGAPSLRPTQAGARLPPDRRDARPLARRMRSGALPPGYGPAVDEATMRALSRVRKRPSGLCGRPRCGTTPSCCGTIAALPVGWPTPAPPMVVQDDVQSVTAPTERLGRLALARHAQGHTWRWQPGGEVCQALRGVQGTVAGTTGAALDDLTRFAHPRQRLHDLGLTPSASARGARRQPGSLTKIGKTHARRALVEGAWASRSPATVRRHVHRRLETRPTARQALSWQAQVRFCNRYRPRLATGQQAQQVVVAMARAWRALLGARATQVPLPPQA